MKYTYKNTKENTEVAKKTTVVVFLGYILYY